MDRKTYLKLETSTNYCILNENLIKSIGLEHTYLLKLLISCYFWNKEQGKLTKEEEFYCTEKWVKDRLNIKLSKQNKIRKDLVKKGFIQMKRIGVPPKNFFKINLAIIIETIKKDSENTINSKSFEKQSFKALKSKDYIYNNRIINNRIVFNSKELINEDFKKSSVSNFSKNELPVFLKLYWNTKHNLSKHRDGTQNCINCKKALRDLMKGTYFKKNKLDTDYMEQNNILKDAVSHKFTRKEIKAIIQNLDNFHNGAYFPTNSNKYPKGFLSCLYNAHPRNFHNGGTSLFLRCFYNPPKLIASSFKEDKYSEYTKCIIDFINERREWLNTNNLDLSDLEKYKLACRVADIICAFKAIIRNPKRCSYCSECEKNCRNWDRQFMELHIGKGEDYRDLLNIYFDSLKENFVNLVVEPRMLGPNTKTWHKFCNYIFKTYKICLENVRFG